MLIKTTILVRRGTEAEWATKNPILKAGEPGFVIDRDRVKFGDGTTPFLDLDYVVPSAEMRQAIQAAISTIEIIEGPQGPPGANGEDGSDGPAGPPGIDGVDGSDGPAGPVGPKGDKGDAGSEAARGYGAPAYSGELDADAENSLIDAAMPGDEAYFYSTVDRREKWLQFYDEQGDGTTYIDRFARVQKVYIGYKEYRVSEYGQINLPANPFKGKWQQPGPLYPYINNFSTWNINSGSLNGTNKMVSDPNDGLAAYSSEPFMPLWDTGLYVTVYVTGEPDYLRIDLCNADGDTSNDNLVQISAGSVEAGLSYTFSGEIMSRGFFPYLSISGGGDFTVTTVSGSAYAPSYSAGDFVTHNDTLWINNGAYDEDTPSDTSTVWDAVITGAPPE